MKKLATIIVDDEEDGINTLRNFLTKYCPDVEVIDTAASVAEAVDKIKLGTPDLVFLDINMPGSDGFQLFNKLPDADFSVVFVTAYDEYALKAFKHHAVNYILKPVNIDELIETVARVKRMVAANIKTQDIDTVMQAVARPGLHNKIALPVLDGLVYVNVDTIIRCEAENNYTVLHFTDRPKLIVSKTLGSYERLLQPFGFYRVHHQHLINLAHLERYQRGRGGVVTMSDKQDIAVSQRKRDEFLRIFESLHR
jgi:two-component system LytT family response regulator